MQVNYIKQLIAQGEGLSVELKESKSKLNKDIYESVCAFLNRAGGHLILGVKDDRTIVGVDESAIEAIKKDFATTMNNAQKFAPPVYLDLEVLVIEDKKILYTYVPKSKSVHTLNGKIYDRNNDSDIDITGQNASIAYLYLLKQDIHTEDKIFPYAAMDDLDLDLIKRIRIVASNRRVDTHPWEGLSDFELLKNVGLYKIDKITNKEGLTLGALLLFGKDETILNALPHYKTDLILRKINLDRYDDREIITTNLIDSYYKMMEFVKKHLNDPFYLEGDTRISLRDKIFREAVANSLIHREYSSAYVAKMIIQKDKVVFENANIPHFYGALNPTNFTPYPKNPSIAKVFREIGFADELGSGVKNLFKYAKRYGGADPLIVEGEVFKLEIQTDIYHGGITGGITGGINDALAYIAKHQGISAVDLSKNIQVPLRTIQRWLKQLTDENKIEYNGSKKTGGYFLK